MRLSSFLERVWLSLCAYFVFDALLVRGGPGDQFDQIVSIAVAGYCLLFWGLLRLSPGLLYRIMLVFSVPILVGYVLRLAVLGADPTRLKIAPGIQTSQDGILRVILYLGLSTIVFWAGGLVALRLWRPPLSRLAPAVSDEFYFQNRRVFIGAALLCSFIAAILPLVGLVSRSQSRSTEFSVASQLLPLQVLTFILMALVMNSWSRLGLGEKWAALTTFSLTFVSDFVGGRRGTAFTLVLIWLVVLLFQEPRRRLNLRRLGAGAVFFVLIMPTLFSYTVEFRESVDRGGTVLDVLTRPSGRQHLSGRDIAEFVTDRLATFDATFQAITYNPQGLDEELTTLGVARTAIARITPDFVYSTNRLNLGRLWGHYYDGVPRTYAHAGVWSGLGLTYRSSGWFGLAIVSVWAFVIVSVIARMMQRPKYGGALSAYACYVLVVQMVFSGNIDDVMAQFVAQVAGLGALVFLVRVPHKKRVQAAPRERITQRVEVS